MRITKRFKNELVFYSKTLCTEWSIPGIAKGLLCDAPKWIREEFNKRNNRAYSTNMRVKLNRAGDDLCDENLSFF